MAYRSVLKLSDDRERSFFGDTEEASLINLWEYVEGTRVSIDTIVHIETKEYTECLDLAQDYYYASWLDQLTMHHHCI